MKDSLQKLLVDFLSTIGFLAVFWATGSVIAATCVAIAVAVGQFVHSKWSGRPLSFMTVASLGLAIALGVATLMTNDPRFVLMKPSIAHFAIGAIMLRPGWMLRYLPPIVSETVPGTVRTIGYAWAALMFALGAGVIGVAMTGDLWWWGFYVSVIAIGAKIVMFAITYSVFRICVRRAIANAPERIAAAS